LALAFRGEQLLHSYTTVLVYLHNMTEIGQFLPFDARLSSSSSSGSSDNLNNNDSNLQPVIVYLRSLLNRVIVAITVVDDVVLWCLEIPLR